MSLAENLKITLSASIAFDRTNADWASPYNKQKERTNRENRNVLSFFVRRGILEANAILHLEYHAIASVCIHYYSNLHLFYIYLTPISDTAERGVDIID